MIQKASCESCNNENCLIKRNCLTESGRAYLTEKHTIQCKKGQSFIIEGAPVHGLFFVYKGKVKVTKTGINEREQILRFSKDGEIIGHRGFGSGEYYRIGAAAIEDSILCSFNNNVLNEMLQNLPDLTYDFMLFYADELNKSETKVRKFAQMTVREKVIDALLYFNRKFGRQEDGLLNIVLPRKDIADFAGTTEEQVIRMLSSIKSEGLIFMKGKQLGIVDLEKMKREISEHNFFLNS